MMTRLRKTVARTIAPLRLGVREFRDYRVLQRLTREQVDVSALCLLDVVELSERLEDEEIANDWQGDSDALQRVNPPDYASGVNPGDQRALYTLVRGFNALRVLEVGTHIGSSTLAIALACRRKSNEGTVPSITTVDIRDVNHKENKPWAYFGSDASPKEKLKQLALDDLVEFRVGDGHQVLSETSERFNFIFLDGSHQAPIVYREISAAIRSLAPGGVVVMHDVFPYGRRLWPESRQITGPWQAVSRMVSENPALRLLPLGELPWPTKYGGHVTSLAVLARVSR